MKENDAEALKWADLRNICTELSDGAFMATVQADGRPHLAWVGIGFGVETLWTATYASSQKAKNLRHSREVALHWPERPDRLVFMRAVARLVEDRSEARELWSRQVLPYDQALFYGSPDNPDLLFVELVPAKASVHDGDPTRRPAVWRRSPPPPADPGQPEPERIR
jgi:general stress protein 26